MPFTFGETSFNKGDGTGIQCIIVKGDLPMNITWSLNSLPIFSGENDIHVLNVGPKTSLLNIIAVDEKHRGIYKCIAKNLIGYAVYSSELHINGYLYIYILIIT